jgi:hypothetical protein
MEPIKIEFEFANKMGYIGLDGNNVDTYVDFEIDYHKLIEFLKKGNIQDYDPSLFKAAGVAAYKSPFTTIYLKNLPEIEVNGEKRKLSVSAKLSTLVGKVNLSKSFAFSFILKDTGKKDIYYMYIPYENNSGKNAIIISSDSFEDFDYIVKEAHHTYNEGVRDRIFNEFKKLFIQYSNKRNVLDKLYEQAPIWVIARLGNEKVFNDLKILLTGNIDERGTNEELVVLKIMKSFVTAPTPIDEEIKAFSADNSETRKLIKNNADFLLDKCISEKIDEEIVFAILYRKINDYGGEDNFSFFINLFYTLWLVSKYPIFDFKNDKISDVILINYESKKILGFYFTNKDLNFKDVNISVTEQQVVQAYSVREKGVVPMKMTFEIERPHIYQPINIPQMSQDGELKLPENIVPAFFLKAIDDKNAWSNFEKATWLTIDVISTISGVGNLLKLRNLRYLVLVRNAGKTGQTLNTIRMTVAGIQVLSGVVGTMLNFIDSCDGESKFCNNLRTFLIYLDLASLGVEGITSVLIKKAARNALDTMPQRLRKEKEGKEMYDQLEKVATTEAQVEKRLVREAFRQSNKIIQQIEKRLDELRTALMNGDKINVDKIISIWKSSYKKTVLLNELKKTEAGLLASLFKKVALANKGQGKNIALGELEMVYKSKTVYTRKDYLSNAGWEDNIPGGNGAGRSVEKVDETKMIELKLKAGQTKPVFKGNDSEIKCLAEMDEDIAKMASKLNIDINNIEVRIKIHTTFDPCIVCKRDLIIRKQLYSHSKTKIEVFRPFYKNESGVRQVVKDSYEYEKLYLKQK